MTYQITDAIPLPAKSGKFGRNRDPFSFLGTIRRLEVGQSFFAANKKHHDAGACVRVIRKRDGLTTFQITSRTVVENGIAGVRVWRIS